MYNFSEKQQGRYTLKRDYNKLILRLNKADVYFQNESIPIETRSSDKIIKLYNELIAEIGQFWDKYKELYGEDMPKENKIKGF